MRDFFCSGELLAALPAVLDVTSFALAGLACTALATLAPLVYIFPTVCDGAATCGAINLKRLTLRKSA